MKSIVQFDDFTKLDLRVGRVVNSAPVPESQKLIKLDVDFGNLPEGGDQRTILTGLASWYEPAFFEGKLFVFVTNLEPKKMVGIESQGMLLSVDSAEGPKPVEAPEGAEKGQEVR